MKKFYIALIVMGTLAAKAQQVSYKYEVDAPDDIVNYWINLMPLGFETNLYHRGNLDLAGFQLYVGLDAHARIKNKFWFDMSLSKGYLGSLLGNENGYNYAIGGAYVLKRSITRRKTKATISVEEKDKLYSPGVKIVTEKFIMVDANRVREYSVRGGVNLHKTNFEREFSYKIGQYDTPGSLEGYFNTFSLYAGIMSTGITNLVVRLNDGQTGENRRVNNFYVDLMVAPAVSTTITRTNSGYDPDNEHKELLKRDFVGWRFGWMNAPSSNGFGNRVTKIEVGYKPGLMGYYTTMTFAFSLRGRIGALN